MTARRIVVIGTGTDVGKTFVSAALVAHFHRAGVRVRGWKCVASGVTDLCEDATALARAAERPLDPPLYSLRDAVSLHLAARREGVTIDIDAIARAAARLAADIDVLLVETAGGLFSPLAPPNSNAELVLALGPDVVVLVAPDRLGVLHDVRATLLAAEHVGVRIDALVLSAPASPDASTGSNASEIALTTGRAIDAVFPRATEDDPGTHAAASSLAVRCAASR